MKISKILAALFCTLALCVTSTAAEKWLGGPNKSWYVKLEDAMAAAKKSNKKIFVLKTGSDWCGWCVKLNKDVFNTGTFKRFARKNLVLVYLDRPSRKKMPVEQLRYNQEIYTKLGLTGGYPSYVILDADGKVLAKKAGYMPLKRYMAFLEGAVSGTPAQ